MVNDVDIEPRSGTGFTSFTELPLGELDRMKSRSPKENSQITIGFPRKYIMTQGATPVLSLKRNKKLMDIVLSNKEIKEHLKHFVVDDDVSAFQELRVLKKIPITEAVWILSTDKLNSTDCTVSFKDSVANYKGKYGNIAFSYWNQKHQMEALAEWQYMKIFEENGSLLGFKCMGEYYWKQIYFSQISKNVKMAAGNKAKYQFKSFRNDLEPFLYHLLFLILPVLLESLLRRNSVILHRESIIPLMNIEQKSQSILKH